MTRFSLTAAVMVIVALASSAPAGAAITYVDANPNAGGNTTLTNGALPTLGGNSGTDNNWQLRTDHHLLSTVLEAGTGTANNANAEDAPVLRTAITGLTSGATYDIYGYWGKSDTANWDIRFGLSEGTLTPYGGTTGDNGAAIANPQAHFANGVSLGLTDSSTFLRETSLGTAIADGSGVIYVFADDNPNGETGAGANGGSGTGRSWYDGVGYELASGPVVPAPAALPAGLVMLAAVAGGHRRRI